jgi:uncharacterized membrane protein
MTVTTQWEIAQWVVRAVLAVIFLVMGVLHFVPGPARGMAAIIPPALKRPGWPSAKTLVRFTGLCELAGGVGLLLPPTRVIAAVALIVFLVAVFPANTYAARHPERFGRAAIPFWPRLGGQLALIALCVLAAL